MADEIQKLLDARAVMSERENAQIEEGVKQSAEKRFFIFVKISLGVVSTL